MAIVENETLMQPPQRLFTTADLEALPNELPSGPIDYELHSGRLVFIMVPPGNIHGAVQLNIGAQLLIQGKFKGHGEARTEVGVVLGRNPDSVLTPDVLFIAKKSLPIKESVEGYLESIPELVVEVRSKNDSQKYLQQKAHQYLGAGVEIVWIVDSQSKTVAAHTSGDEAVIYGESDSLALPSLIPGFSLAVADIFRE